MLNNKAAAIDAQIKDLVKKQKNSCAKKSWWLLGGFFILLILTVFSLTVGAADISIADSFKAFFAKILPFINIDIDPIYVDIIWDMRMPRIATALICGCAFGIAGTAMQGVTRNPLVEPYTIGVSAAAGFGASLALILGLSMVGGNFIISLVAFSFAMLAVGGVYLIAKMKNLSPESLVLSGVAVTYLFSAATSFLHYGATEQQLTEVVHWLFGSLSGISWVNITLILAAFILAFIIIFSQAWNLNALAGGEDTASSLGVKTSRTRFLCMGASALTTAVAISFTGIIGFIGLLAPHISRMIIGQDHRFLVPFSCIVGAVLLLASDAIGRIILAPIEIPVGIMTAFVGVPFFIYIMIRNRKRGL
ncbi:MAG: iron ABC transporter permease [Chloroflexi bacterium]|nr:iron ABC transporter permease [Chloroflexota bacterium]